MRNRWKRWRAYLDALEEAARVCGQHLAELDRLLRAEHERHRWPEHQRRSADIELVRRGLDIPFLREVIRAARRVGPDALPPPPDVPFREWEPDVDTTVLPSSERHVSAAGADAAAASPAPDAPVPARLRAVERALQQRTRSLTVLLEQLTNPGNASAVLRTAEVFGLQEVHLVQPEGRAPLRPAVTCSAHRYVDLHWHRSSRVAVAALRRRGFRILAADHTPGAGPLEEIALDGRTALAFGSEQLGVSPALRQAADGHFHIPAAGFTSYLNVSTAAAIAIYAVDRRLRAAGLRAPLDAVDRARLRRSWYTALARGNPERLRAHLAWLENPPQPAPARRAVPSREKARESPPDSG